MYEVECKIEMTKAEREKLVSVLREKGFLPEKSVVQNDFYVETRLSPYGGKDHKRYRDEGDVIFHTEKIWEKVGDRTARRETEKEISREEFTSEMKKYPNPLSIRKSRDVFSGTYAGRGITVDMDSVKFDHSPAMRYFVEAEIITQDKGEVATVKNFLLGFLRDVLEKATIVESPGMFAMASEKL